MAKRTVIVQGKNTAVNAEGNEKVDGTSTTSGDLDKTLINDLNLKVAGLSNGKRMSDIANLVK